MKKTLRIFSAAAIFLFAACSQNELEISIPSASGGVTEFNVETESATKVVFGSDLSVSWAAGDQITVFGSGKGSKFSASAAGTSSSFALVEGEAALADTAAYFAAYPASGWSIDDNVLTGTIPNYQIAVPESINTEYLLMAARSSDKNLAMKNLVALLKITLSDDNVSSVNIVAKGGAKIAGSVKVTFSESGDPVVEASASSVMLVPERDSEGALKDAFEPGDYYIAVAPAAVSAGIEVVLTNKDDDNLGIKSSSTSCNLYRSEVMNLGDLCSVVTWPPTVKTGLTFWNDGFVNPIASPSISMGTSFSYDDESKYSPEGQRNVVLDVVANDANGGLTYKMFSQKGYWKNSNQGLRSFPDKGDYIEFPAFPGLSLKAVKWTFGGIGSNDYPGLATTSGEYVCGGEPYRVSYKVGDFAIWTNLEPAENTAYRVTPNASGSAVSCRKVELLYIGTPEPLVIGVVTGAAENVKGTSATLKGSFNPFGSSDIVADFECGFEYKTGSAGWTSISASAAAESFSVELTGLTEGQTYTYRAWAKSRIGEKVYGVENTFMPSDLTVVSICHWDYTENKSVTPFTSATKLSTSNANGINWDKDMVLADGSYTFHFHASYIDMSSGTPTKYSSMHSNGSSGMRINAMGLNSAFSPTYISIPVIPGKKLVSVTLVNTAAAAGPVFVCSDITNGTTATSTKLENKDMTPVKGSQDAPKSNTIEYTAAVAGTQYYLVFAGGVDGTSTGNNYIAEIKFSFSK